MPFQYRYLPLGSYMAGTSTLHLRMSQYYESGVVQSWNKCKITACSRRRPYYVLRCQERQEEIELISHMAAIGPKNTVYPPMNDKNFGADAKISQGHRAHPPIIAQITCPRRMLMYCGRRAVMSFAALKLLAEIFAPNVAIINAKEAKNEAARLSHLSMRCRGSQRISP